MTQPTERRFVMEPRLDAEVETINLAIDAEETARIAGDALKVAKAGDTMTGALTLPADPTNNLEAATKQYVDATVAGGTTSGSRTIYVKAGMALTKGQPVYISGANGTNVIVSAAGNGSETTSSKTIGLINSTVANNGFGYVTTNGLLSGLDTSGATAEGDAVWLGPSGTLLYGLSAKPVAPAHLVYIGIVTKKNASTGEILINPQNGFELDELHNVLITSPANGQSLTYDNATGLWKNATPASTLNDLTDVTINSGTLSGGQVIKYDSGTTQWVNGAAAGGVTAAATAPNLATSAAGDAWFDTNDGTLYVCYVDVDSTKQWVQVQANSALEASLLSRVGALEASNVAAGTTSPNYIINGGFDFWQRGTSLAASGYLADRFTLAGVSGFTQSRQSFTPGAAPVAGYEAQYYWNVTMTSSNQNGEFLQRIEDARTLAGQTVTLSFWARSTAGAQALNCNIYQHFGTGGSPSSLVQATGGGTYTPTSSWQRYTFTFTMPSVAGKTFGTNNDSFLWVRVGQFTATTTNTSLDIWGVQLERGTVAASFRRNSPNLQGELAACQRYYYRISGATGNNSGVSQAIATGGTNPGYRRVIIALPSTMRAKPTVTSSGNIWAYTATLSNIGWGSIASNYSSISSISVDVNSSSTATAGTPLMIIIDSTNATDYIEASAEL